MAAILHFRAVVWLRLIGATALVFLLLAATGILGKYYFNKFGRIFGPRLGRIIDFGVLRCVAPITPLFALTFDSYLGITISLPRGVAVAIWFLIGLVTVEAYSAGLCLRSMQTSAPEIPRPTLWRVSWRGRRDSDIRLHRLLEVHVIYVIVPCLVAATVTWHEPAPAFLSVLYLFRYLAFALDFYDFEAVVHWHMHTRSLAIRDQPTASAFVNVMMNYAVGPINGYVPRLYETEHMRLHHRYDSGPGDPFSPMPYRRTSLIEFSWFAMRVISSNLTGATMLADWRLSWRWRRLVFLNVIGYWLAIIVLLFFDRPLGVLLPIFAALHGLDQAKSQYKWHGLPDADNLEEPLGNTILWVASEADWRSVSGQSVWGDEIDLAAGPYRDWTYFDNYHLIHHLYPSAHFDRYLDLLRQSAPKIIAARAIVMTLPAITSSVFDMWSADIDALVQSLLTQPPEGVDKHEFIRRRLEPVPQVRHREGAVFDSDPVRRLDPHLVRWLGFVTSGR
jgi:hypothetical protein